MSGPLQGVRVAEFGNLIAAPYAAMLLADLGADVVKVEPPSGDLGRGFGPFLGGESAFFLTANRGKRSIVLDLGEDTDARIALALCETSDVVLHNLRRGAMERRGLGYSDIRSRNPDVVYAVISAFGSDGPDADRVGIDVVFQAESGMISITGDDGGPPAKTATTIGDYVAGTNAALAISAALAGRSAGQGGRRIDVSLRDGLVAVQAAWNAISFVEGGQPSRTGTASPFLSPNQLFEAADAYFALAIVSDRHFGILCQTLGAGELASAYPTNADRMAHRHELTGRLQDIFRQKQAEHWVSLLGSAGLPVGRVLDLPAVRRDAQVLHNRLFVTFEHPAAGEFETPGSPIHDGGSPAVANRRPPLLGEHTAEILEELRNR